MNTDQRTTIKELIYGTKDEQGNFHGGMIRQSKNAEGEFTHRGQFCKANYPDKNREERKSLAKFEARKIVGIVDKKKGVS